jgi:translation initiation factor 2 subunit 2
MDYDSLLKRGLSRVPEKLKESSRFEMPRARVQPAGARTIITNFNELGRGFRREDAHVLKFLLKELATKGELEGSRLVVLGRFSEDMINRKLGLYAKQYVLCPQCGKPDTRIIKEGDYLFLKCEACGSRHPVSKV